MMVLEHLGLTEYLPDFLVSLVELDQGEEAGSKNVQAVTAAYHTGDGLVSAAPHVGNVLVSAGLDSAVEEKPAVRPPSMS